MIPLLFQPAPAPPQAPSDADLFTQVMVWVFVTVLPTVGSLAVYCGKKFASYLERAEERQVEHERELMAFRKAEEAHRTAEVVSIAEAIRSGGSVNKDVAALRWACADLIELVRTSRPDWNPEQQSAFADMQASLGRPHARRD